MTPFAKLESNLRGYLHGRGFVRAIKAMEFAKQYHGGFRKDKVTPEFSHQVAIANLIRTLEGSLLFPEDTYVSIFLHDTPEDNLEVSIPDIIVPKFGQAVGVAVELVTNHHNGIRKDKAQWFAAMAYNPIASLVKAADRAHNLSTMVGVFTPAKQAEQIFETETYILPMLKVARKLFPEQEAAYQNLRHNLMLQVSLLKAVAEARDGAQRS